MADHVTDTVVDHFVSHGDRLFRVTGIVIFDANQFVAFYAAFGVDVSDGLFRASKFHIAILGNRTGHRAHDGDFNIFCKRGLTHCQCNTPCQPDLTLCYFHPITPLMCVVVCAFFACSKRHHLRNLV